MEQLNQLKDKIVPILVQYGLNIVWAIVILIIGWVVAKWVANRVKSLLAKTDKTNTTLDPLLVKITRFGILSIVFLMVLNRFGVQTASIIALLGTVGLAVGLALQGSLSNVASGIMIFALQPFKAGDTVNVNGRDAVINEVGLFVTEMHTFDNVVLHVTNTKVWEDVIENHSQNATRRIDMTFRVGYEEDIDRVFKIIYEIVTSDERVLSEPEPFIGVQDLAESWISLYVRPWAGSDNHFQVQVDLQKRIKERFDEEGISIPFPQQVEHQIADR